MMRVRAAIAVACVRRAAFMSLLSNTRASPSLEPSFQPHLGAKQSASERLREGLLAHTALVFFRLADADPTADTVLAYYPLATGN